MELFDNIGAQFGRLMVCEILRPCPNLPLSSWWYPDSTQDIALAKNLARHLCANQENETPFYMQHVETALWPYRSRSVVHVLKMVTLKSLCSIFLYSSRIHVSLRTSPPHIRSLQALQPLSSRLSTPLGRKNRKDSYRRKLQLCQFRESLFQLLRQYTHHHPIESRWAKISSLSATAGDMPLAP